MKYTPHSLITRYETRRSLRRRRALRLLLGVATGTVVLCGVAAYFGWSRAHAEVRVIDGDTFVTESGTHIRLWGIDAPECDQPFGRDAALELAAALNGAHVTCTRMHTSHERLVAMCFAGGLDLAERLVRAGLAWDWPAYSRGWYADAMAQAQADRRGLWSTSPVFPPWQWRMEHEPTRTSRPKVECR